ncbi:MAG: hypothetical protein IT267_01815 [Saprospiraceae bacterium]|nr:hypothetical protein [Saprospiraceae bacterium]
MQKVILSLLAITGIYFVSCTSESGETSEICFETEVRPIISSNCTLSGCHNSIDKVSGYDFSTYEGIMHAVKPGDHSTSELYKVLIHPYKEKPPKPFNPLSEEQKITIAAWIEQGAKYNPNCVSKPCDTTSVTLSRSVRPILNLYCGSCHNSSSPQGGVDFRTYENLRIYIDDSTLTYSINHINGFAMPKNSSKLPACEIGIIQKWIALGAPNN